MFKTNPFVSEKPWGYERWILSTHPAGESIVDNAAEFIGGKKLSNIAGQDYPLLVKIIQANDTLSVQVHPNDEYAKTNENSRGKTECWYILDAEKDATLICGINFTEETYNKEEFAKAIEDGTLEEHLKRIPVKKGDFIFIPAGTVHAIQGGLRLLEVQQSSDITYRLYDWGRPREIHVEKSLDVILPSSGDIIKGFSGRYECNYFTLEKLDYSHPGKICFAKEGITNPNPTAQPAMLPAFDTPASKTGWVSLVVTSGEGTLVSTTGETIEVHTEDCIMIRYEEDITVLPKGDFPLSMVKIG